VPKERLGSAYDSGDRAHSAAKRSHSSISLVFSPNVRHQTATLFIGQRSIRSDHLSNGMPLCCFQLLLATVVEIVRDIHGAESQVVE